MDFTKELEPFICDRIGEISHNLVQSGSDSDLDRLYKYLSILTSIKGLEMQLLTKELTNQMSNCIKSETFINNVNDFIKSGSLKQG